MDLAFLIVPDLTFASGIGKSGHAPKRGSVPLLRSNRRNDALRKEILMESWPRRSHMMRTVSNFDILYSSQLWLSRSDYAR